MHSQAGVLKKRPHRRRRRRPDRHRRRPLVGAPPAVERDCLRAGADRRSADGIARAAGGVHAPAGVIQRARGHAASTGRPRPTNSLRRAGEIARRADVRSLLALREEVAQRAASKGEQGPSETRRQLDEIERYLSEARALQLQRDAEELRRSEGGPAAPR